jgi:L-lysine 2,3-aminomutase
MLKRKLTIAQPQEESVSSDAATDQCVLSINDYYRRLVDRTDAQDSMRRLIAVMENENGMDEYDRWDEAGLELEGEVDHGYSSYGGNTVRLSLPDVRSDRGCGCSNCAPLNGSTLNAPMEQLEAGLAFIESHAEISNVWLSGRDSFVMPTSLLGYIMRRLSAAEHVRTIRLESKLPILYPMRVTTDMELLDIIRSCSRPDQRIYVKAHIHHPNELTLEARSCFEALRQAGAIVVNHTPIWKGINDDSVVLSHLLDCITQVGVTPNYFYVHNSEAAVAADVSLPLAKAYTLVEETKTRTSGFGKRVRLYVGHASGRIEVLAIEQGKAYLKYVQSRDNRDGQFMIWDCPDEALFLDEQIEVGNEDYAADELKVAELAGLEDFEHTTVYIHSYPMRIIGD